MFGISENVFNKRINSRQLSNKHVLCYQSNLQNYDFWNFYFSNLFYRFSPSGCISETWGKNIQILHLTSKAQL